MCVDPGGNTSSAILRGRRPREVEGNSLVELPEDPNIKKGPEPDPNVCASCAATVEPGEKCLRCGRVNNAVVKKY